MDNFALEFPAENAMSCVEMHTTGEPTRIIYRGYPRIIGTLLWQREEAKRRYDHIRRRLMFEPRGHFDMYGAVLRPETELTKTGQAHMGVLFLTNEGYSTMCGHATIALGRFLLDCSDESVFPQRTAIVHDAASATALLKLHAPCGLLEVTVPTTADGRKCDPSRPVSFVSVPSFATCINVGIRVPLGLSWTALGDRDEIVADFAYGGAFFCFVDAKGLGFKQGLRNPKDFGEMREIASTLKHIISESWALEEAYQHPEHEELSSLYSVVIVDKTLGTPAGGATMAETGLCFFADDQVDRSPTGSAVAARVALAAVKHAGNKPRMKVGERRTYHSIVSNSWSDSSKGGFTGSIVERVYPNFRTPSPAYRVRVEGFAFYTGVSTFVVDQDDPLGDDGFLLQKLSR